MPTYSYKCENGHEWEDFRSVHARKESQCPECSVTGFQEITAAPALAYDRMGTDPYGLPTAAAKWERMRKQRAAVRE